MITASSVMPINKIEKWFANIEGQNRQPLLHESIDLLDLIGIPTASWRMVKDLDTFLKSWDFLSRSKPFHLLFFIKVTRER